MAVGGGATARLSVGDRCILAFIRNHSRTRVHAQMVPRLHAVLRRLIAMKAGEMTADLVNLPLLEEQERTARTDGKAGASLNSLPHVAPQIIQHLGPDLLTASLK